VEIERQKKDVLMRLRRIEGQLRGIQRMVEKDVSCPEILTQVVAATAALKKVATVMVHTYMDECLEKTQKEFGSKHGETLKDFKKAMAQYIDWT
jgi:DNA-binding FrmR family transcriptional regulator